MHTDVCVSGGKKCSFFGKFDLLCFLETPVLRFALLPHYGRNVISLVKFLFSCHSGNQIFTYNFYICSSLVIINNQNSFELVLGFVFDSFLNCLCSVLLFLSLARSERISHRRCSLKVVLTSFAKLTGKYLCRSRLETLQRKRIQHRYCPVIFTTFPGACSIVIT